MNKNILLCSCLLLGCALVIRCSFAAQPVDTRSNASDNPTTRAALIAPARVVKASANARFILNADQVYDKKNNLTWARCSLGQTWDSYMGCVGVVKQWNFDQVQARLDDGWRVPTHAELLTLIDPAGKTSRLPIDVISFPNLDADKLVYWSVEEEDNSFAWAVIFIENGINASLYRSHRYAIRLVRSGK